MGTNSKLLDLLSPIDGTSMDAFEELNSTSASRSELTDGQEAGDEFFMAIQLISVKTSARSSQSTQRVIQSLKMSELGKYLDECSNQDLICISRNCFLERIRPKVIKDRKLDTIADIYIVFSGSLTDRLPDDNESIERRFGPGCLLGESVFEKKFTWEHDVFSLTDVFLCCIPVSIVLRYIGLHSFEVTEYMRCFWKQSLNWIHFRNNPQPLFMDSSLQSNHYYQDIHILLYGKLRSFNPGELIFSPDNDHFSLYVVYKGECSLSRAIQGLDVDLNDLYGLTILPGDFIFLENISLNSLYDLMREKINSEYRETEFQLPFGNHCFQLKASTFVQIITIPLHAIMRSRAVFIRLISVMHKKFPSLLYSEGDILNHLKEKSAWRGKQQSMQVQNARITRLQRTLNESFFVHHMNNLAFTKYCAIKGGVKRISRFIQASNVNTDVCILPQAPKSEKSTRRVTRSGTHRSISQK